MTCRRLNCQNQALPNSNYCRGCRNDFRMTTATMWILVLAVVGVVITTLLRLAIR